MAGKTRRVSCLNIVGYRICSGEPSPSLGETSHLFLQRTLKNVSFFGYERVNKVVTAFESVDR